MKCLQTNLGRGRVAHNLAYALALEIDADLIIISEPNIRISDGAEFIRDKNKVVAVQIINKNIGIEGHTIGKGYISLKFKTFHLYCCYISPNITVEMFENSLDIIMNDARSCGKDTIIAGDLNSKSPLWGAPMSDRRGSYLADWASELNLIFLNTGDPTFERGNTRSHIDVTCASPGIASKILGWQVLSGEFQTYHNHILYEVNCGGKKVKNNTNRKAMFNRQRFSQKMETELKPNYDKVRDLVKDVKKAVEGSTGSIHAERKNFPYWWNENIENNRTKCIRIRRNMTRLNEKYGRENVRSLEAKEEYDKMKKSLRNEINKSKRELWRKLCEDLEEDIWGNGYKIAVKRIGRFVAPYNPSKEQKIEWCRQLFPNSDKKSTRWIGIPENEVTVFTAEELQTAAKAIKSSRAPGIDKIPPEAVKILVEKAPQCVLEVLNRLLRDQSFPKI